LIALAGAFIYAELSSQTSDSGGQYVYLREAFHPSIAFIYGWTLLLVIQTGGMAAVAVTFAKYLMELGGGDGGPASDLRASMVAAVALALLTPDQLLAYAPAVRRAECFHDFETGGDRRWSSSD
jgi:APA family basic amino acid/polyamine antiporter